MESKWEKKTTTFDSLVANAHLSLEEQPVFNWLKSIGIVPKSVDRVRIQPARLELEPDSIDAGYLAAAAWEWDQWTKESGEPWHHPIHFLNAIEYELKGRHENDNIREILTALGKYESPLELDEEVAYA